MSLVIDAPPNSLGTTVLQMTSIGGQTTGGNAYKNFPAGFSQLYLRYLIKYSGVTGIYHHTGGVMGGFNPLTDFPQGTAGIMPNGTDFFQDMAQADNSAPNPLRLEHYAQWPGMMCCFGNYLMNGQSYTFVAGQWHTVELMLKRNNPLTDVNGEVAIWLDGVQVSHLGKGFPNGSWSGNRFTPDPTGTPFVGLQWSTVTALPINWINLQHYQDTDPTGYVNQVWFDHVVVATSYVGPIAGSGTPSLPPVAPSGLSVR
jgi:hypothetical protein